VYEASRRAYGEALQKAGKGKITTEILSSTKDANAEQLFYYAEDYHQQYLAKPGGRRYCSAQPQQVSLPSFETWAPEDLREKFSTTLSEEFWTKYGPKPHCVVNNPDEPIQWPE